MQNLEKYKIQKHINIRTAIATIDKGAAQIVLVVDEQNRMLGTVTDGDVRRGLLKGETLESPVASVMNYDFRWVEEGCSEKDVLKLMHEELLHQIPMLDEKKQVIRLFLIEELLSQQIMPNTVVFMAGGEGLRLRPLTESCPKPMLLVKGKPMLEILMEQCRDAGLRNFYLAVNYLKQQVMDYFEDGKNMGVNIRYIEEKKPLGTAGALSLLPEKQKHPLLVLNADLLTKINVAQLLRFHSEHNATATVCVFEHLTKIPYGVVNTQGTRVMKMDEKPVLSHFVNAGVYVINPVTLKLLSKNIYCDMPIFMKKINEKYKSVHAFPIHEFWLDIGQPESLKIANGEWENNQL